VPNASTVLRASRRAGALAAAVLSFTACTTDELVSPRRGPVSTPAGEEIPSAPTPSPDLARAAGINAQVDRFAWAVQPYNDAFPWGQTWTPTAGYSYNSSGGAITFTRLDVGSYNVNFEGLSRPGIGINDQFGTNSEVVVATAAFVGLPGIRCNALSWMSWLSVSRLTARVDCVNAAGQFVDTPFSVLVVGDASLSGPHAFALADKPTLAQYTPDKRWSYTTGPGVLGVAHNAFVGGWDWRMGTGAPAGKIHLVNANANPSAPTKEHCQIAEYKSLGASVRCFDHLGAPKDAPYQILQVGRGRYGKRFGFAWADQHTRPVGSPYSPHASYVYNSSGGAVQVERLSFGYYRVVFQGLQSSVPGRYENVQVSAFGGTYTTCNTNGWLATNHPTLGPSLTMNVMCSNKNGQPTDSRFNVMVIE
jgi:hypothetical protein